MIIILDILEAILKNNWFHLLGIDILQENNLNALQELQPWK